MASSLGYLWRHFGGSPYISTLYKKRVHYINKISCFVGISRLLELALLVYIKIKYNSFTEWWTSGMD